MRACHQGRVLGLCVRVTKQSIRDSVRSEIQKGRPDNALFSRIRKQERIVATNCQRSCLLPMCDSSCEHLKASMSARRAKSVSRQGPPSGSHVWCHAKTQTNTNRWYTPRTTFRVIRTISIETQNIKCSSGRSRNLSCIQPPQPPRPPHAPTRHASSTSTSRRTTHTTTRHNNTKYSTGTTEHSAELNNNKTITRHHTT